MLYFPWFEWIWYHEPTGDDHQKLGRFLGPAHDIGQGLAYYILSEKGKVVVRSTIKLMGPDDELKDDVKEHKKKIRRRYK